MMMMITTITVPMEQQRECDFAAVILPHAGGCCWRARLVIHQPRVASHWSVDYSYNIELLLTKYTDAPNVTVVGPGSIVMDFGVESAAWVEFDSFDLGDPSSQGVNVSIGESNQIYMLGMVPKTDVPVQYNTTYRLETNSQLYEGVRFAWITSETTAAWHITGVRSVCQIKPTNYTGAFSSSDPFLDQIWYVGAYNVKVNLESTYFGAVLVDRGDRYSWTGDAHVAQACALVAFADYSFILENINRTANNSNGIESYALYWVLSVLDYYQFTADASILLFYSDNIAAKLNHSIAIYNTNASLGFFGWDDRLGSGFVDPNCPEAYRDYQMLAIRAMTQFAQTIAPYQPYLYDYYTTTAQGFIDELRADWLWYESFGLHSSADAVNARFTTPEEEAAIFAQNFNDSVLICSYSSFNMYWILQALGNMGMYDYAIAAIKLCWGGMIELGGTTYWEIYSPEWTRFMRPGMVDPPPNGENGFTSMCHPWSSGVTYWMTENILGVKATEPGFYEFDVVPRVLPTLLRLSGHITTIHGEIAAAFDFDAGSVSVNAPAGLTYRIGITKAVRRIATVSLSGTSELIWPSTPSALSVCMKHMSIYSSQVYAEISL